MLNIGVYLDNPRLRSCCASSELVERKAAMGVPFALMTFFGRACDFCTTTQHTQRRQPSLRSHPPCITREATMPSMKTVVLSFLASVLVIHTACAFVASPASVSRVSYANSNKVIPTASRAASYKMRSQKSLGPLLMAEGDAMEAAQATAKKLNDQAAALREAAASSEAEIRPPSEEGGEEAKASAEPTPEVRPEDQAPPQKISNDMKDRLRKELTSQGADPNKSAGNPILVVAAVIAVLVVAGGKGIFY